MVTAEDFRRLKAQLEATDRGTAQAEGGLQEVLKQLKVEFSIQSPKEIKALMEKMNKEVDEVEALFEQKYQETVRTHKSNLEKCDDDN